MVLTEKEEVTLKSLKGPRLLLDFVCDAIGNYKLCDANADEARHNREIKERRIEARQILFRLGIALTKARDKHPEYARSTYEALEVIRSEFKELEYAMNKENRERQIDEAFDVLVVTLRFILGESDK